ncbi:unnamed protein product [Strongylus vulgaris]|uniref:Uncharacterized protein n=1 Tax=Strongylus vulgaris TaxID=40348 RepID=A0A3P7KRX2_STRVU|nr:unnamed protein product [Strongylus vulgaris]
MFCVGMLCYICTHAFSCDDDRKVHKELTPPWSGGVGGRSPPVDAGSVGPQSEQRGYAYYQLPSARAMMIQSPPLTTMDDEVNGFDFAFKGAFVRKVSCSVVLNFYGVIKSFGHSFCRYRFIKIAFFSYFLSFFI